MSLDQTADGSLLTLGRSVRLWSVRRRSVLLEIHPGEWMPSALKAIRAHPVAAVAASVDWSGGIALWDTAAGRLLSRQFGDGDKTGGCAWPPDGTRFAACVDDYVWLWDLAGGELRKEWSGHHHEPVKDVCFTPDGSRVLSAGADNTIRVWAAADGQQQRSIEAGDSIFSCTVTRDGSKAVAGGYRGTVMVFDLTTGERLEYFKEHPRWADSTIVAGDAMGGVFVLELASDKILTAGPGSGA